MPRQPANHCAICGTEVDPEEEFCDNCKSKDVPLPCPLCGKIICECEVGGEGE